MRPLLTGRQREVLLLVANGSTAHQAGRRLGIATDSVNSSLQATYRGLGVHGRAQAVAVALRLGLLRLEDIQVPGPAPGSYPAVK